MKWINIKDNIPQNENMVLACINNEIYLGCFNAIESYNIDINDGSKKNYIKTITFNLINYVDFLCGECMSTQNKCDGKCIDCCELNHMATLSIPSFNIEQVDYWMPLPDKPDLNGIVD